MGLYISVSEKDHIKGTSEVNFEVVEYGDYQCPHCGEAHPIVKTILEKFGAKIRFVFRNFPLTKIHPQAMQAATAAEAAAIQGKFWEMHHAIFENQKNLTNRNLITLAQNIGLDLEKFEKDRHLEELRLIAERDFEGGLRSGVNRTPSFFINGEKFQGEPSELEEYLFYLLSN